MIVPIAGGPVFVKNDEPQAYSSLRTRVMWSFSTHSVTLYGPVPTGIRAKSERPAASTAAGETIPR